MAYTYDKVGNILSITNAAPQSGVGGSSTLEREFEYDALYRLLSATGRENQPTGLYWDDSYRSDDVNSTTAYTQNYDYDLMGNLNELQHTGDTNFTRTYNHSNNLLDSFEVGSNTYYYQYDACGNQIQENEERHMQWDYADKLRLYYNQTSSGTEPSVYTHYLYDAGGNRVKKYTRTTGGDWETITYIDGIIEYRENQDAKLQSLNHVMDTSTSSAQARRIATIREGDTFGDSTPAIKYNLDDHLGSSNVLVDNSGTLVNQEEYYPFGETSFGAYAKKRYRFCGKEKDEESGMYYYGARYYSPWLCRFISVDPLAAKYAQLTPYNYAGNEPIGDKDIDGMQSQNTDTSQTSAPSAPAAAPTNQTAGTNINCHQVQKGETLGGIAKKYGTTVEALAKANNISDPNKIEIGQELDIPAKQASKQIEKRGNGLGPGPYKAKAESAIDKAWPSHIPQGRTASQKAQSNDMHTSPKGRAFLTNNEGTKSKLYNDSKGHATIGVGHLVHKGKINGSEPELFKKGLTPFQIDSLLTEDLKKFEGIVNNAVQVPLTQEQFDAIISFTFNVGEGNKDLGKGLKGSVFLSELNKGKYNGNLMMNFHRPAEIIPRRQREVNLFNSGKY